MFEEFIPLASLLTSLAAVVATWIVNRQAARERKLLMEATDSSSTDGLKVEEEFKKQSEIVRVKIQLLAKKADELSKSDGLDYDEMLLLLKDMSEIQSDAKQSVRIRYPSAHPQKHAD